MSVVTRFAPSPTGLLHLGNLRAALLNWLLARKAGGVFILRIDDTDRSRARDEHVEAIREDLRWLGLFWDREERQSARRDLHRAAADRLREAGRLYPAWESAGELARKRAAQRAAGRPPVYDRAALALSDEERAALAAARPPHWRFLLERRRVEWTDGVLGPQTIDAASLSDPVLVREDGRVLYALASVADDIEMGVTDIVRGADHVANTAVQIQLFAALGAPAPRFAHHALLVGPGGEPLSKRADALSVRALREAGVEPTALLSLLARSGTSAPAERRLGLDDLIAEFDLSRLGAASARLDPAEIAPFSARVLRALPFVAVAERLAALGISGEEARRLWRAARGNLDRFEDIAHWAAVVRGEAKPAIAPEDADFVAQAFSMLPPPPWTERTWSEWTAAVREKTGRRGRALFLPLRRALTGRDSGPDMAALMPLMRGPPALAGAR